MRNYYPDEYKQERWKKMGLIYSSYRKTMTHKQDKKNTKDNQCDINNGNKQVDAGIGFQGILFTIDVCA